MNRHLLKIISGTAALILAVNVFCGPLNFLTMVRAEQDSESESEPTMEDLEAQKAENEKKIEQLKKEIEEAQEKYDSIVSDENAKLEYQNALNEKIDLQNENISVVIEQMNQIDDEIQDTLANIADIEEQIKNQNMMIDANMKLYKQRLRASYMAEGDTISSILAGSRSFLDLLSKFEIVSKVAEHDNNLIEELGKQLKKLKELNKNLGQKQDELSEDLEDATERKDELDEKLAVLQDDYDDTQEELNRISGEKYTIAGNIEENEEIIAMKEAEQQKIDDEIEEFMERLRLESIRVSESVSQSIAESIAESEAEASRKAEEERKKAEEEKRRAEAAASAAAEAAASAAQNNSSQQTKPVTQPPATPAPEPETPAPTPAPTAPPASNSSLMKWPVPGYTHHSSYWGDGRNHQAIDIDGVGGPGGAISGAKVYAAADGYVAAMHSGCNHTGGCSCGGGYGNYVGLAHTDGVYSTYYAHLQAVYVTKGQFVHKGDFIGLVGTTGYSTGPHLHFEVRKNGTKTNPDNYDYE